MKSLPQGERLEQPCKDLGIDTTMPAMPDWPGATTRGFLAMSRGYRTAASGIPSEFPRSQACRHCDHLRCCRSHQHAGIGRKRDCRPDKVTFVILGTCSNS